jgi:hypothetical protein
VCRLKLIPAAKRARLPDPRRGRRRLAYPACRAPVGPRAGQKLFTLQTVPPREEPEQQGDHRGAANAGGFSLHAGLDIQPHQREKLERLCRYVSRPPIAVGRLALTSTGQVRYQLKTPYRDGTTHIVLEPLDLMARLAALVPPPRMHLTRFHGVFAPHSKLRAAVTPAHRGVESKGDPAAPDKPITPRHMATDSGAEIVEKMTTLVGGIGLPLTSLAVPEQTSH